MKRFVLGAMAALAMVGMARAAGEGSAGRAAGADRVDPALAQQLQSTLKAFEDAWNRHDPAAMAAVFADDAVLINPSGRVARGRAQIEKLFDDEHRGQLQGTRFTHRLTDARQVAPGVAFVDEEMTIAGGRGPDGQARPEQRVHGALLVAKQADGSWKVLEGRPYAFLPQGAPRDLAAAGERGARSPGMGGTGSGAQAEDPAHVGP